VKSRGWHRFFDTLRARLSLPLLGKELTETAARRRTYILRVVYALLLFLIFWFTVPSRMVSGDEDGSYLPYRLLGFGRQLFEQLTIIQIFGVLLFQPALMCGRITQEKERDSLVLLFLTKLRPWEIVLQKYLGGLVPMLSFLLLGLPLAGVAYAFGGVESRSLMIGGVGLLLLCLQVGALALMCSAWCRTTVSALISSYVVGIGFYLGPPLVGNLVWSLQKAMNPALTNEDHWRSDFRFSLIPQAALELATRGQPHTVWVLAPSILSVFVLLLLTRLFLVRRAFLPPFDLLQRIFKWLDRVMKGANRFVGGVVLYRDGGSIPIDDPIFWRETQRRVLGKPHYLFRLLCALEIPTVLLCLVVLLGNANTWSNGDLSVTAFILAALAMFTLSATAANSIVSERVGQTLEVLLTTPLKATQIIRQKERALRRLEWILAVPLITIFASRAFIMAGDFGRLHDDWVAYFTCATLMVLIYLPMITWLSLWIGLRVRTRFQAILAALGALTSWMALTPLLAAIFDNLNADAHSRWWLLVSPVGLPSLNEFDRLPTLGGLGSPWPAIVINAALYTIIALAIRRLLFRNAERCLRR
jgi:ABC-type transport system involved in multi-copper enzyme maturation permease subunit